MEKIDLPGGAWASLRDPAVVTERQRKPFVTAMGRASKFEGMDDSGFAAILDLQDSLVLALVDSWSFDAPVSADGMLDLPAQTVDALRRACQPFQAGLLPDFAPTPDPASPSAPSSD